MKYIHLFYPDENEKFSVSYYNFLKENFNVDEHIFYIPNHHNKKEKLEEKNVIYFKYGFTWLLQFFLKTFRSKKLIIHGLPNNIYFFILFIVYPRLSIKSYWTIWGGDLYYYQMRSMSFRSDIAEFFRNIIIKRFKYIVTHIEGDYELAKKWYHAKGEFLYSFMYPSNLYKEVELPTIKPSNSTVRIQLGNSACSTNNHIQMIEALWFLKEENVVIYCPLSYSGEEGYIKEVVSKGFEVFGEEKFVPMINFLSLQEYLNFLSEIDVAVFNHDRQRGLGNIISLLGIGKKVYLKETITTWDFFMNNDIKVFPLGRELEKILIPLDEKSQIDNKNKIKSLFSEENLKKDLDKIFQLNESNVNIGF